MPSLPPVKSLLYAQLESNLGVDTRFPLKSPLTHRLEQFQEMASELLDPLRSELSQAVAALRLHTPVTVKGVAVAQHARGTGRGKNDELNPPPKHHFSNPGKSSSAADDSKQYSSASSTTNVLRNGGGALTTVQINGDFVMRPKLAGLSGGSDLPHRTKVHRTRSGEEGWVPSARQLRREAGGAEPISASSNVMGVVAAVDATSAVTLMKTEVAGGVHDEGARLIESPGSGHDEHDSVALSSRKVLDVDGGAGRGDVCNHLQVDVGLGADDSGNVGGRNERGSNFVSETSLPPRQYLSYRRERISNSTGSRRPRSNIGWHEPSYETAPLPKPRDVQSISEAATHSDRKLALSASSHACSLTDCRTAISTSYQTTFHQSSLETMAQYSLPRNRAPLDLDQGGSSKGQAQGGGASITQPLYSGLTAGVWSSRGLHEGGLADIGDKRTFN